MHFKGDTVALTYPHTHTVSHTFHASVTGVLRHSGDKITHILPERCYPGDDLAQGRNRAVRRFLGTDAEWLWTVDTDMGFFDNALERLLTTAEETSGRVVSALYNIVVEEGKHQLGIPQFTHIQPMAGMWNNDLDGSAKAVRPTEVTQVDAVGAGCLLMHRSVFEDTFMDVDGWWDIAQTAHGARMGEDFSFCRRLQVAGIPIWLDPTIPVVHHKDAWV